MIRKVNRSSDLPLHAQVKQRLRELIEDEVWLPGQSIPTEKELEREFEVSRSTVRQALQDLVHDGYIRRQAGKGTFVMPAKLQDSIQRFGFLMEGLREVGYRVRSQILELTEFDRLPSAELQLVDLQPDKKVVRFRRLYLENDTPFGLSTAWMVLDKYVCVSPQDLEHYSIFQTMERHNVPRPARAERSFEAVAATGLEQRMLGVPPHSPLLLARSVMFSAGGARVGVVKSAYRGDRFRYMVSVNL